MLLGNKKLIEEDQDKNWCVVLGALENEIDRKRVAQRISEIFSISTEEAGDLVRSTPIILLDQLSRLIANKLKDYFASFGAPLILSKDVLFKRKCYRTVWPQNPCLSFLHDWRSEEPVQESDRMDSGHHEALNPDQALDEIRAMMAERITKKQMSGLPSKLEIPISDPRAVESLKKNESEVSKFGMPRAAEVQKSENLEPAAKRSFESVNSDAPAESSEIKALRDSLRELKSRYDQLNDQYDRSRQSFENQIISQRESNETLLKKLEATSLQYVQTQEETQKLAQDRQAKEKLFQQLTLEQQGLLEKFQKDQAVWAQESEWMRKKIEGLEAQLMEFHSFKTALESHKELVAEKVQSLDQKWTGLEARGVHYVTQEAMDERLGKVVHDLSAIVREEIQKAVRVSSPEPRPISAESEGVKALDQKVTQLFAGLGKQFELTEKVLKLVTLRELPPSISSEAHPESKPAKTEALQPQWNRAEHEKQLAARLADKESLLRRLVVDQERIEKEIHDREDQMRRVLAEQEKVEKEIMEVRQAQRQFLLFDRAR